MEAFLGYNPVANIHGISLTPLLMAGSDTLTPPSTPASGR
jgi:hypothetical protein